MTQSDLSEKPKSKFDTGVAIGLVAILINIITVSVYMYQAKIMREQLHSSSWPYLEWLLVYNQEQGLKLEITNNGVGPALIKDVEMRLKGVPINPDSLFVELIGTDYFPHLTSRVQNRVLSPQNSIKAFQITNQEWSGKIFNNLNASRFEFLVCYESIYGDKWTTIGTEVIENGCR
ncbi:MAG: hypothetical protein IPK21_18650 [Haliscomenobacter sp.]|nr:hypothetical protein [Haliscomenobacter sp.]